MLAFILPQINLEGDGPSHYPISSGNYLFDNPNHRPLSDKQERDWKKIQQAAAALGAAKKALLTHIRRDFVEIDVNRLNDQAWKEFWEYRNRPLG